MNQDSGALAVIEVPEGPIEKHHEPAQPIPDIEIEDAQVDPRTEDDRLREELLEIIQKKEAEVAVAESNWEELKTEANDAKKVFDKRVAELRNLVRQSKNLHEETPLFNQPAAATPTDSPSPAEPQDAEVEDDSWKIIKLDQALQGVPESLIEKLEQHEPPLRTLGELTAWLNADQGRNQFTDIKGVGRAKADQIEEALAAFWTRWANRGEPTKSTENAV